jgi:hypothetical protein
MKNKYPKKNQTEHSFRKAPGYFQWDVIPGACVPYALYFGKVHFLTFVGLL